MVATHPRPTSGDASYVEPSSVNAGPSATAYPDQWGQPPTADNHIVSHAAFDAIDGVSSSLVDDAQASTLDSPWG
ncbi:MAG TPA: hypothetical protein VNY55_15630 [Mycobacterium sp.]|jgi:hypothetical protein|nr:hypothetical protein [Mycobacterium sp.]